jgi:hypothetical protein
LLRHQRLRRNIGEKKGGWGAETLPQQVINNSAAGDKVNSRGDVLSASWNRRQ